MARARALCSLLPLAILTMLPASVLSAAEEVDTRRFPRLVRLLLLPEEEAVLKQLRDQRDRLDFQRIFWARRDPSPGTLVNEFEETVRAAWTQADVLFTVPGQRGSETGCGQILALLGRPQ
jgi:GWxTD domain-containing protein